MKFLKTLSVVILIAIVPTLAFGYWGLFTKAGNKEYRELAYIIPWLSLVIGLLLFTLYLMLLIVLFYLRKREAHQAKIL